MLKFWGEFVARRALLVLLAGIAVVLAAGAYGSGVFGSLSDGGFDDPDTETSHEIRAESDAFGNRAADVVAIYSDDDLRADDPAFEQAVRETLAGLPAGTTAAVTTYYDTGIPDLLSTDGHATQVLISLAGDSQDAYLENYNQIKDDLVLHATEAGLTTHLTGSFAVFDDVNHITETDLQRAELLSLPIVLVLSLLIFGSVVAAGMPVLVGIIAVIGGLAMLRVFTQLTEVSVFSVNVITLLGLGLAIDYALFIISRFREELALDGEADRAIVTTMRTAGRTVLFSGLTVAAAMSSLLVFPQSFLRSMGFGGISAVVIAMVAALTILPAILRLLGRRIDAGRLPWRRGRPVAVDNDHGAWARVAHAVMRRPVLVVVGVTAVLLLIASPFLGVRWGSVDYRVLPEDAPSRVAAEKLNSDFGEERATASIMLQGTDPGDVEEYAAAVRAVPGVEEVRVVAQQGTDHLLHAVWGGNAMDETSREMTREIRDLDPNTGTALVGGMPGFMVDLLDSVGSHLPLMALIIMAVMMVLLFLAFGSLVLPIKAIIMNVISISASFGVVTWVFSDGHLENVLGFESQGFLDATQPILMFAILFGLSMDYEVFLLSRVREQYDKTGDNTGSVALGLQKTGRIITSAALLLAVVIGAFGTSGIVFMKMIGLGMLVALLIDATVVRALLVPATMKLLGNLNWWAPGPLRRWWDRYGFREEIADEPARETVGT